MKKFVSSSGDGVSKHVNPLDFRIRARDDDGHYEKLGTTVPPELDTEIKSLVASEMFDFDGTAGFLRWAAVHGIEFLKSYKPKYPSQISIVRAISLENARSEVRREFKKQIESTAKEAFELAGLGYTDEAAKHVHRILLHIRKMDPQDPWRAIFETEMKQRFGFLLAKGKVSTFALSGSQQPTSHPGVPSFTDTTHEPDADADDTGNDWDNDWQQKGN